MVRIVVLGWVLAMVFCMRGVVAMVVDVLGKLGG